jgi:hypothetical protein
MAVNWDVPQGLNIPAPLVTPIMKMLNDMNIIWTRPLLHLGKQLI